MAKKKKKVSFYGLDLTPEEDAILAKLINDNALNGKSLLRKLIRQWIEENK